ncbi:MAG: ATP-binding cassette domain-containing protein [Candidatus Bipolaricaulota bacterium]|nr:ATP-binding cassette domain-containing protein [Candidatus Bipolaricaulota bacterium]
MRGLVHHLFSFGSRRDVLLNGVDLTLEQGEIVLLMGRNGSGKTTLARYLAGLLIPKEGTVTVDGVRTDQDPRAIRRRVGLLFQESHEQIIAQTPLEDVAFGLENLALSPEDMQGRAMQALERVGLREKALCTIESLTPAERQRVALAGVLAMEPTYYILDEPDRTADRDGLALLLALVRELRTANKGVLIISHKEFWREHVDRVVHLEHGKATENGFTGSRGQGFEGSATREPANWRTRKPPSGFHLRAQALSFHYNSVPALGDVSAAVTAGEFIVITGPEGSGKTTLVELLAGLTQPSSGCVLWNDTPIHALTARERVRCVGLVFQEPYQQLLGENVQEEILLGLSAQGISPRESEQRARWACEAVGLDWDRFSRQPSHRLSGGEQARLALAAMLALHPSVLILDETLSALDPAGQSELLALLQALHAHGMTVILVTPEVVPHLESRLWVLEGGQLVYDGPSQR